MKKLLKFLVQEKALLKFVRNYNLSDKNKLTFRELKNANEFVLENIILYGFWWTDSPEKRDYWNDLNSRYRDFRYKNNEVKI